MAERDLGGRRRGDLDRERARARSWRLRAGDRERWRSWVRVVDIVGCGERRRGQPLAVV